MALKIRLSRGGAKKRPFYKIVVAEALSPRDGKFIERLGSYNPMVAKDHAERLVLDVERAKYWLSKGAQPTLRVAKMLSSDGLVKAPVIRDQPIKSAPGKKRQEREARKRHLRWSTITATASLWRCTTWFTPSSARSSSRSSASFIHHPSSSSPSSSS